jgi:hypothetical protein
MKPERIAQPPPSARSPGLEAGGKLQPEARAFYRRWVGWTVAGEAAGFAVAASAGVLVATQDLPTVPEFALLVGAGSIEGALLGGGQAIAMARLQLPPRMLRRWPVGTSVAAALAWSIGLLPSSIPHIPWSSPVTWLLAASSGRPCCYPSPPPSTCCCEASFTPPGAGSGSTSSPGRSASVGPSRPRH